MRFRMLGPLEVVDGDQPVALGGIKQRATLGFLLLRANRVVATSQLLKALWPVEDAPISARKILQNAVWGLRRALSSNGGAVGSVALSTRAPGYLLRVEPDQIDLYRFQRLVEKGRAELAAGSPEAATLLLRDALALWWGPVLADLVETGVDWPELTAVQNARSDAMEDYFEAELACGRHHAVLGELELMLDTEAPRERSCGQLMLALYRCGRQTDALSVYGRVRSALIDNLGLEPGRGLQELQHSILTHDPALILAEARQHVELRITGAPSDGKWSYGTSGEPHTIPLPRTVTAERKDVSVLMVRTQLSPEFNDVDPEGINEVLDSAAATVRDEVERFGGALAATIGSARFIMEFERRVAVHPDVTRLLVGRIPPFAKDNPLALLTEILSSSCGILQSDSAKTARAKLTRTIQHLVHSEEERSWLLTCLGPLVDPEGCASQVGVSEVLEGWRQFLAEIAVDRPLVVVIDDLHCADDVLVDFVEHLAESSRSVPLLVIATARPELLKRRPEWGGGLRHCATITLDPISDTAVDRLLEFLLSTMDSEVKDSASGLFGATLADIGEEPDVRRSYVRKLLASGSAPSR